MLQFKTSEGTDVEVYFKHTEFNGNTTPRTTLCKI